MERGCHRSRSSLTYLTERFKFLPGRAAMLCRSSSATRVTSILRRSQVAGYSSGGCDQADFHCYIPAVGKASESLQLDDLPRIPLVFILNSCRSPRARRPSSCGLIVVGKRIAGQMSVPGPPIEFIQGRPAYNRYLNVMGDAARRFAGGSRSRPAYTRRAEIPIRPRETGLASHQINLL